MDSIRGHHGASASAGTGAGGDRTSHRRLGQHRHGAGRSFRDGGHALRHTSRSSSTLLYSVCRMDVLNDFASRYVARLDEPVMTCTRRARAPVRASACASALKPARSTIPRRCRNNRISRATLHHRKVHIVAIQFRAGPARLSTIAGEITITITACRKPPPVKAGKMRAIGGRVKLAVALPECRP